MTAKSRTIEEWSLKRLLTDVIGSGPKSADDMTAEQAMAAFHRLLDREADPTTVGAFLLANRWKGNTPTELAAFVDVMRERSVRLAEPTADPVDCGANYDGKAETALLGVAAGLVAAAAGSPVVVHSADRLPATRGVTYRHVLDALDIPTDISPTASARMVDETGFGFYYAPRFNPGVRALLDRRHAMGVRTLLNTIETLANPANARVHLGSFFHLSFAERMIDTVRKATSLHVDRVTMVQGLEGYDDARPGRTRLADWNGGEVTTTRIETADYGFDADIDALQVPDVAADSADITEAVVKGDRTDRFADAVAMNAAIRIYAHGTAESIDDGLELARTVLEEGAAADRLVRLKQFEPPKERTADPPTGR